MWSTMRASFYTLLSAAFITSWPSTYTKVNSGKAYLVKTHRDVSNYNYFFKLVCLLGNNQIADCVWNVMAHALKPDFVFLPNGRVHLNRRGGVSVQSTTGRRAVHISLQGLYCSCQPVFCCHVTFTGYPTLFSCFSFTSPPLRHRVPSHFNWTLPSLFDRCFDNTALQDYSG